MSKEEYKELRTHILKMEFDMRKGNYNSVIREYPSLLLKLDNMANETEYAQQETESLRKDLEFSYRATKICMEESVSEIVKLKQEISELEEEARQGRIAESQLVGQIDQIRQAAIHQANIATDRLYERDDKIEKLQAQLIIADQEILRLRGLLDKNNITYDR